MINLVLHTGRSGSKLCLPGNTFSNLSSAKLLRTPDQQVFLLLETHYRSGRDLSEKCSKNTSTFLPGNCNTLESFICVCFAIIHGDQSPCLGPRCQRETSMTSPIHTASSPHISHALKSSHPTTKRDAPSYHPSNRAFYGPSKDNELPE